MLKENKFWKGRREKGRLSGQGVDGGKRTKRVTSVVHEADACLQQETGQLWELHKLEGGGAPLKAGL